MKKILLIISLFLTNNFAFGNEDVFVCDVNCNDAQRQAQSLSMMYNDGDRLSVFDTKTGTATTYVAHKEFTMYGEIVEYVTPTQTTIYAYEIANTYNQLLDSFKVTPISIPSRIDGIPSDSASRIMTEGQLENRIGNYLRNNATALDILQARADNILSIAIQRLTTASINSIITLQFDDLSIASFEIRMNLSNGQLVENFDYVPGSAKFQNGDPIPSSADDLLGNWVFQNESDANGFVRVGTMFGFRFVPVGSQVKHCSTRMTCKKVDGVEVCEVRQSCN